MAQGTDPPTTRRAPHRTLKPRHPSRTAYKEARLYARLTLSQKELLQHAADLADRNLSEFVVAMATERAAQIIQEREALALSARDSEIFTTALLNPPAPNDVLRRAARLHDELVAP